MLMISLTILTPRSDNSPGVRDCTILAAFILVSPLKNQKHGVIFLEYLNLFQVFNFVLYILPNEGYGKHPERIYSSSKFVQLCKSDIWKKKTFTS